MTTSMSHPPVRLQTYLFLAEQFLASRTQSLREFSVRTVCSWLGITVFRKLSTHKTTHKLNKVYKTCHRLRPERLVGKVNFAGQYEEGIFRLGYVGATYPGVLVAGLPMTGPPVAGPFRATLFPLTKNHIVS